MLINSRIETKVRKFLYLEISSTFVFGLQFKVSVKSNKQKFVFIFTAVRAENVNEEQKKRNNKRGP